MIMIEYTRLTSKETATEAKLKQMQVKAALDPIDANEALGVTGELAVMLIYGDSDVNLIGRSSAPQSIYLYLSAAVLPRMRSIPIP